MKLGPIELPTDLILAPLMDVTTPSFRNLIWNQGVIDGQSPVGLVVTPMVFVQQIAAAPKTILPHMEHIEKLRPSSVQIVASGKNPEHIKTALDILGSYQFDVLDINAGCPAPHTMRSGGGGAFLRDYSKSTSTERLEQVITACVKYAHVPVSLKTRLGFNSEIDIIKIGAIVENLGLAFLTVHGRTVAQKYRGVVNYDLLRQLKSTLNIPLVGNGDVTDFASYQRMKATGVDAVMIGRAAMTNPSVFSEIWQIQQAVAANRAHPSFPDRLDLEGIRALLQANDDFIVHSSVFWNTDRFRCAEMRRLAIWFIKGIRGYKRVRERVSKIHTIAELRAYIFSSVIETDFSHGQVATSPKPKASEIDLNGVHELFKSD